MSPSAMIRAGSANGRRLLFQEHVVHALVVVCVVACSTLLRGIHQLDNNTIAVVFGSAIGYAAGRSGLPRQQQTRSSDTGNCPA